MKVQEQNQFQADVKMLFKKFKVFDRQNTKILYQFCQFDPVKTYKVLYMLQNVKNPGQIIKTLIQKPERSQELLDDFSIRYDKQVGIQVDMFKQKKEKAINQNQQINVLEFDFFKEIAPDTICSIMSFLDPYSLKMFSFTNSIMFKIQQSQFLSEYYKSICKVIFSMQVPKLPQKCRFHQVKTYIQNRKKQFSPNHLHAVNNNLRYYIWKSQAQSFRLQKNYYLEFGSYLKLFLNCPRVNMNGYYMCKHKYIKIGEKNEQTLICPIHIIYYYRYIRFLEDGSCIYYVANRKLKEEDIIQRLTKNHLENDHPQSMIGEFMQHKQLLYTRSVKQNQVFSYEFEIRSTEGKISNQLKVNDYSLQLIDQAQIVQNLFKGHPNKQQMVFTYFFNKAIKSQNSNRIKACSL